MENDICKCPNCGAGNVTVSTEGIRPKYGAGYAVAYVAALVLVSWQGFERLGRPYTTQSAYSVAVALAVVAVVAVIALTVIFVRSRRARPCRVQRCPRCGHAVVLEKPVRGSRGWRVG